MQLQTRKYNKYTQSDLPERGRSSWLGREVGRVSQHPGKHHPDSPRQWLEGSSLRPTGARVKAVLLLLRGGSAASTS